MHKRRPEQGDNARARWTATASRPPYNVSSAISTRMRRSDYSPARHTTRHLRKDNQHQMSVTLEAEEEPVELVPDGKVEGKGRTGIL